MQPAAEVVRGDECQHGREAGETALGRWRRMQPLNESDEGPDAARRDEYHAEEKQIRKQPTFHTRSMIPASLVVDWGALLADLTALGFTMSDLERGISIRRTSLLHYLNEDTTPLHPQGEQIIAYWMATTGQGRAQLPLKARPISAAKVKPSGL